jgi:hypothetical protein
MSGKMIAALNSLYEYARSNPGKVAWCVCGEDADAYHRFNQMRVIANEEIQSIDIVHRKITLRNGTTILFMGKFALQLHLGEMCNFAEYQGSKNDFYWKEYVLPALYRDPDPLNKRHFFLEE